MTGYDFDRPYVDASSLSLYYATDEDVARRYGNTVRATEMSNYEYSLRCNEMEEKNNMKPPPSHVRHFSGYLVIRRLGTSDQYETWMPYDVFEEIYKSTQSK